MVYFYRFYEMYVIGRYCDVVIFGLLCGIGIGSLVNLFYYNVIVNVIVKVYVGRFC